MHNVNEQPAGPPPSWQRGFRSAPQSTGASGGGGSGLPLGWGLLAASLGMAWAACAAGESLWLDELHTSWAVAGGWSEVSPRAAQGNQSPLYFWGLLGIQQTLGNLSGLSGELLLRLPSIVAWGATLGIALLACAHAADTQAADTQAADTTAIRPLNLAMAAAIPLWLLLDRTQLFYATEARVYALVQLVSLLGWLTVSRADRSRCIWLWCGLSVLLVFLHITAVLAVAWQIVYGSLLAAKRTASTRWTWVLAVTLVVVAVAIALQLSSQVWEHRQQWSSFAGDASLSRLLELFPLVAYVVPVLVIRGVDRWNHGRQFPRTEDTIRKESPADKRSSPNRMWLLATAGPWLSAWLITVLQVAPILHRRFVIVAAIPLILWAVVELGRVRQGTLRWVGVMAVALYLIISQGTMYQWLGGQFFGWQRIEGWRQASTFLSEQLETGDRLWCASGLIEGRGAKLPLGEGLDRYLSFPLRGLYRVVDSAGVPRDPHSLIGDGASWDEQIGDMKGNSAWIIYRGSPVSFDNQLHQLRRQWQDNTALYPRKEIDPPRAFGLVSLARVRCR